MSKISDKIFDIIFLIIKFIDFLCVIGALTISWIIDKMRSIKLFLKMRNIV